MCWLCTRELERNKHSCTHDLPPSNALRALERAYAALQRLVGDLPLDNQLLTWQNRQEVLSYFICQLSCCWLFVIGHCARTQLHQ